MVLPQKLGLNWNGGVVRVIKLEGGLGGGHDEFFIWVSLKKNWVKIGLLDYNNNNLFLLLQLNIPEV